jgi:hypothetical protein
MAKALIKTEVITDWQSFHDVCKREMGFPDFYGMNMNAWIDCLTYLDEGDGMSRFHLAEGEILYIELTDTNSFKARLPEVFDALVECSAAVNQRYTERGKAPKVSLVFV